MFTTTILLPPHKIKCPKLGNHSSLKCIIFPPFNYQTKIIREYSNEHKILERSREDMVVRKME